MRIGTLQAVFLPEALMMTYQNEEEALSCAEDACSWADVILIGPGIGTDKTAERMAEYVMKNSTVPVIADADCLNIIAENKALLDMGKDGNANRKFPLVVTPHVKKNVQTDRAERSRYQTYASGKLQAVGKRNKRWYVC